MKRIFITGIAGFIGFHLARALQNLGHYVCGCDNFNDYYDPALKRSRAALLDLPILEIDIVDQAKLEEALASHQITHCVHLAAQAGVRLKTPDRYVHSNLVGFTSVLEAIARNRHIKLTYASSSSVYGLNKKIPFSEEDRTDSPANFYGATKKSNELMAHAYHHQHGIFVTGLRFFTVYGPWGRPDMAYYAFARSILEGHPIPVFEEGRLQRDFTYIDDIIQGILAAIDLEAPCALFNLGNNQPQTVLELIRLLEKHLGQKALIEWVSAPNEIPITYADINKSRQELGFHPTTSLDEGLKTFAQWLLAQPSRLQEPQVVLLP
ncbi:MAG: NAD-dependent epimerase/dehydratase family protein [Verrucomicrobia bacterium]|nr:NAD-dependent epimerase/dehydratase family protein [Verrucomicrobiota bacterium]